MSTTYMNLDLPVVGATIGPAWAAELNTALEAVDAHDHSSGKGKAIPSAGILINADLNFNSYGPTGMKQASFTSQGSPLAASFTNCLSVVNNDLYYNNGVGAAIKLTSGSSFNIAPVAGIGGNYGQPSVTALESYETGSDTYHFYEDPSLGTPTYSDIKVSGVKFVNDSYVGTQYQAKIINSASQTENFTLTLPETVSTAGSGKALFVDSTGQLSLKPMYYNTFTGAVFNSDTDTTHGGTGVLSTTITGGTIVPATHGFVNGRSYNVSLSAGSLLTVTGASSTTCTYSIKVYQDTTLLATYTAGSLNTVSALSRSAYSFPGLSCDFTVTDATKNFRFDIVLSSNCTSFSASCVLTTQLHNVIPLVREIYA